SLGYVNGQSISIDYLSAEGQSDRFPALAAECLRLKADIIVGTTTPAVQAAKKATRTIPILFPALGLLHDAFAVRGLGIDAEGEMRARLLSLFHRDPSATFPNCQTVGSRVRAGNFLGVVRNVHKPCQLRWFCLGNAGRQQRGRCI